MIPTVVDFPLSPSAGIPMLGTMLIRPILLSSLSAVSWFVISCGSHTEVPVLVGQSSEVALEGEEIFREAQQADSKGKTKKAINLYEEMADKYPFARSASRARYRQAQLLDQQGEIEDAFEAYDKFLNRFPGSPLYGKALDRFEEIALMVSKGKVKGSFLGFSTDIPLSKRVEMLGKLIDHAPQSARAARAQFAIGEAYHDNGKYKEAVASFRKLVAEQPDSSQAPEALFRVGEILLENAARGNQNQANLDLSREAFNDYLIQYPRHKRNAEARKKIKEIDQREIRNSFSIAEYYVKDGEIESAKVYYRDIIRRTKSGKLHDKAKASLEALGN